MVGLVQQLLTHKGCSKARVILASQGEATPPLKASSAAKGIHPYGLRKKAVLSDKQ
jgi:hypothetical protein